ncbi:AtpZ/AtpI family protein [Methylomonas sp. MgM2]
MSFRDKLLKHTRRDVRRLDDKSRQPASWVGMMLYGGTLGLLFVVPIIAGAYLGRWLDMQVTGFSIRWTVSFILLGIIIGAYNVLRFLREKM